MLTSSVRCEPLNSNKKAFKLKVNRLFSNRCIGYIENKFEQVFFEGGGQVNNDSYCDVHLPINHVTSKTVMNLVTAWITSHKHSRHMLNALGWTLMYNPPGHQTWDPCPRPPTLALLPVAPGGHHWSLVQTC